MKKPTTLLLTLMSLPTMAIADARPTSALDASDPEAIRQAPEGDFGPGALAAYRAKNGMVTSSCAHATMAGLEILRAGGNAFDAAVAVQLALTVSEPYASGIGGGFLALGHLAGGGGVIALDAREEAPESFGVEGFMDEGGRVLPFRERATGAMAAGVPGTVAGLAWLLENHGTMTLAEVSGPAIRLARHGFIVSEVFAANLATHWGRLGSFEETRRVFSRDDGSPLQAGDRHLNPDLAETLETLAAKGVDWFYRGELAGEITTAVANCPVRPGTLRAGDLANYRPVRREPVRVPFRGHEVVGMNLPSSGGVTLGLMLNLVEATGYADLTAGSPEAIQRLIDIQNLAFADRNRYLGDADFVAVPVAPLLDKSYAANRATMLRDDRALPTPVAHGTPPGWEDAGTNGAAPDEGESTTHFVVVDRHHNIACVTSTIEQHFGCGIVVPGRGFLLNNELTDFSAEAADESGAPSPNLPGTGRRDRRTALGDDAATRGGKRPLSSMTPTLVLHEGRPVLALGSPGGSRIIGITFNTLLNIMLHDMEVQAAVNAPRIIARNGPAEFEPPLLRDAALVEALAERNVDAVETPTHAGSVQAVIITEDGWLHGAADPRREGVALGY